MPPTACRLGWRAATWASPPEDMARHIAWDPGAAGWRRLAERLDGPCILSDFSRLVIDPNRGEDDPTLVMKLYDGTIIPANRHARRRDRAAAGPALPPLSRGAGPAGGAAADTVIVAVHSFTPCLRGRAPRPWAGGVLYSHLDDRLSRALLARLGRTGPLRGRQRALFGPSARRRHRPARADPRAAQHADRGAQRPDRKTVSGRATW
jgi:predicted N-formylglutamate amidohydrolase